MNPSVERPLHVVDAPNGERGKLLERGGSEVEVALSLAASATVGDLDSNRLAVDCTIREGGNVRRQ